MRLSRSQRGRAVPPAPGRPNLQRGTGSLPAGKRSSRTGGRGPLRFEPDPGSDARWSGSWLLGLQIERCEGDEKASETDQKPDLPRPGRPRDRLARLFTLFAQGLSGLLTLLLNRVDQVVDAGSRTTSARRIDLGRRRAIRRCDLGIVERSACLGEKAPRNLVVRGRALFPARTKLCLLANDVGRDQLGAEGAIGAQNPSKLTGQLVDPQGGDGATDVLCPRGCATGLLSLGGDQAGLGGLLSGIRDLRLHSFRLLENLAGGRERCGLRGLCRLLPAGRYELECLANRLSVQTHSVKGHIPIVAPQANGKTFVGARGAHRNRTGVNGFAGRCICRTTRTREARRRTTRRASLIGPLPVTSEPPTDQGNGAPVASWAIPSL